MGIFFFKKNKSNKRGHGAESRLTHASGHFRVWRVSPAGRTKKKERLLVVYSTYTVREKREIILKSADSETICRDNKGKT